MSLLKVLNRNLMEFNVAIILVNFVIIFFIEKPFTELNNTKQVNNRLDTIEENEQNESDCINKNSKFSYIPSFNKYTWEVSQSPKTSCISSVNTSRYKKSFYNDKTKIGNSKLKQPSAQPRHKITSKSIDVGSSTQTWDTKTKEKQNSTKLRLPTPTKNWKFILNCKNVWIHLNCLERKEVYTSVK